MISERGILEPEDCLRLCAYAHSKKVFRGGQLWLFTASTIQRLKTGLKQKRSVGDASRPETLRRRRILPQKSLKAGGFTTSWEGQSPSSPCRHETLALFLQEFG